MFDGKRHIWVGWIWDRATERDSGASQWGGTMSLPREISAGKDGQLLARPAPEVTAIFRRTVFDLRAKPTLTGAQPKWRYADGALVGEMPLAGSQCSFDAPDNYMVQCTVKLDPKAQLAIVLREQGKTGEGYRLTLRPALSEAEIAGPGFAWPRKIALDATKPITIQAFVQGTIIEAFINDQYAFTCRAYDYRSGKIGLNVTGGTVKVMGLRVLTPLSHTR